MHKSWARDWRLLKSLRSPISLLILIICLWFLGAYSFQFSSNFLSGIFGPIADLQNIFSPVNTLFTGIAVWGAIYTIYKQVALSAQQQFENIFFNLLNIHDKNSRGMLYPTIYLNSMQSKKMNGANDYIIGQKAFILHYELLKNIYKYILYQTNVSPFEGEDLPIEIKENIDDLVKSSLDQEGKLQLKKQDLFKTAYEIYHEYTDQFYSNYARHLYHTLNHIHKNSSATKSPKPYIQILRAQFSIHETSLLYYRALWSNDRPNPACSQSKYQILIEKSAFMHLLCDDMSMLFDDGFAGEMDDSAFTCAN